MKRYAIRAFVIGFLCGGILTALVVRLYADAQQTDRQAILATEQAFQEALARKDYTAVGKFLDADFEWTAANGKISNRAEVLKNLAVLAAENGGADFSPLRN